MPRVLPYYPRYPKDFLTSETVLAMSLAERGLYNCCLDLQWVNGSIPDDPVMLARMVGAPLKEVKKAWPRVRLSFVPHASRSEHLVNSRLSAEMLRSFSVSASAVESVNRRYERTTACAQNASESVSVFSSGFNNISSTEKTGERDTREAEKKPPDVFEFSDAAEIFEPDACPDPPPRPVQAVATSPPERVRDRQVNWLEDPPRTAAPAPVKCTQITLSPRSPQSRFHEFWARYRLIRDAGGEDAAAQLWLSYGCEARAPDILTCMASYEASRDVRNGCVNNVDSWLYKVFKSGFKARWPAYSPPRSDSEERKDASDRELMAWAVGQDRKAATAR